MNLILTINGGIGKNIAATAVCRAIKCNRPEDNLIIITGHPEVFLNNPNVYRVFRFGHSPYFYEDYIKNKEVDFFLNEPYNHTDYILNKKHLIQCWVEQIGFEYKNELPELYLTPAEIHNVKAELNFDKPVLIFQPFGGPTGQSFQYNWNRDLSYNTAQTIVDKLQKDYNIIQLKNSTQPLLKNVAYTDYSIRQTFALLCFSDKRILIDSFAQHATAALNLPSSVCWITNSPRSLGYQIHTNIEPDCCQTISTHKIDSVLNEYDFSGNNMNQCPFLNVDKIFDIDEIISTLNP